MWSHSIFLVWGRAHNETTKKSKNEKMKMKKKTAVRHEDGMAVPPPPLHGPAPLAWVPPLCLSRPPEGPGPGPQLGAVAGQGGQGCWLVQPRPWRPGSGGSALSSSGWEALWVGGFGYRGGSSFCSGDCLDGLGTLGAVVSSSRIYKVTESPRRRHLGQLCGFGIRHSGHRSGHWSGGSKNDPDFAPAATVGLRTT